MSADDVMRDLQLTRTIARCAWAPPEEMPEAYQTWSREVRACSNTDVLADTWREAYSAQWHFDLIQYPLLRRLYEIVLPNAPLYLHLQAVANHTEWATTEEVDGKYCIEAFFFFPDDLLASYCRVVFLLYERYPPKFVQSACKSVLANYAEEAEIERLHQFLEPPDRDSVEVPEKLASALSKRADSLLRRHDFGFLADLRAK